MNDKIAKIATVLVVLLINWPFGAFLALVFSVHRWLGLTMRIHWERFPKFSSKKVTLEKFPEYKGGCIYTSNHYSLLDPFFWLSLFSSGYLLHPFRYAPMIVVDKNLWHDSCFWGWFSRFFIPVDRGSDKLQISVIRQIKTALETGKGVLIFLEGGRTCRAKEGEKLQQSAKGKKMRFLHSTAEGIARITGAPVIPLWIQGTDDMLPNSEDPKVYLTKLLPWKRIQVVVGEPLFYQKLKAEGKLGSSGMFTQILSAELLALADEIP